jgi:hypothetical protein
MPAGLELMVDMAERRAVMYELDAVWPDYAIGWAYDGTVELAGYVGADLPPHSWDQQPELRLSWDRKALCHLVSFLLSTPRDNSECGRCGGISAWHGTALLEKVPTRGHLPSPLRRSV